MGSLFVESLEDTYIVKDSCGWVWGLDDMLYCEI